MAYCAKADLVKRFGDREISDLLDRDNDGAEDTRALESAISDADALIDGYLSARYAVPLSSVPALIVSISCDLTRYKLWDDRAPEEVRKRYQDALSQLRDISKGVLSLPSTSTTASSDLGGIEYTEGDRLFTMDSLRGF